MHSTAESPSMNPLQRWVDYGKGKVAERLPIDVRNASDSQVRVELQNVDCIVSTFLADALHGVRAHWGVGTVKLELLPGETGQLRPPCKEEVYPQFRVVATAPSGVVEECPSVRRGASLVYQDGRLEHLAPAVPPLGSEQAVVPLAEWIAAAEDPPAATVAQEAAPPPAGEILVEEPVIEERLVEEEPAEEANTQEDATLAMVVPLAERIAAAEDPPAATVAQEAAPSPAEELLVEEPVRLVEEEDSPAATVAQEVASSLVAELLVEEPMRLVEEEPAAAEEPATWVVISA